MDFGVYTGVYTGFSLSMRDLTCRRRRGQRVLSAGVREVRCTGLVRGVVVLYERFNVSDKACTDRFIINGEIKGVVLALYSAFLSSMREKMSCTSLVQRVFDLYER